MVPRAGYWHIIGTLRVGRRSIRLRESTGFLADQANWEAANTARFTREAETRAEVLEGKRPSVAFSNAADQYLHASRSRPLNPIDVSKLKALDRHFQGRLLDQILESEWHHFVEKRQAGNKPQTRERYLAFLLAFLKWCAAPERQWLKTLPRFNRDPKCRKTRAVARRRVVELSPKLIMALFEAASPHLRAQLAVEHATGARVSSIVYGCRLCDLILAPGRECITFHDTKPDISVTAALTPFAIAELKIYLEWRGRLEDREGPLFLTHTKQPYANNGKGFGGQTKTAWKGMQRRAIKSLTEAARAAAATLERAGDPSAAQRTLAQAHAETDLVGQVTPHWLRHNLATRMLASGSSIREVMDQGGWLDPASALIYGHDVPETRQQHVRAALDLGTAIDTSADTSKIGTGEKRC